MKRRTSIKLAAAFFGIAALDFLVVNILLNIARFNPGAVWAFELSKKITSWLPFLFVPMVAPLFLSAVAKAIVKVFPHAYITVHRSGLRALLWDDIWEDESGKQKRRKWLEPD